VARQLRRGAGEAGHEAEHAEHRQDAQQSPVGAVVMLLGLVFSMGRL
jgi:hypothetical protein